MNACGASTVKLLNPNSRANAVATQSAAGGLSTVIAFPACADLLETMAIGTATALGVSWEVPVSRECRRSCRGWAR